MSRLGALSLSRVMTVCVEERGNSALPTRKAAGLGSTPGKTAPSMFGRDRRRHPFLRWLGTVCSERFNCSEACSVVLDAFG